MPRKTDSHNPSDWIFFAESDLAGVRALAASEISHPLCQSKLAEELNARNSDLCDELEPLCDLLAERYFTDRYPGFDLDDPDWPALREQARQVSVLLGKVKARVAPPGR